MQSYPSPFPPQGTFSDTLIAWGEVELMEVLEGQQLDEWFPLSGKQGADKEGVIHLNLNFDVRNAPRGFPLADSQPRPPPPPQPQPQQRNYNMGVAPPMAAPPRFAVPPMYPPMPQPGYHPLYGTQPMQPPTPPQPAPQVCPLACPLAHHYCPPPPTLSPPHPLSSTKQGGAAAAGAAARAAGPDAGNVPGHGRGRHPICA